MTKIILVAAQKGGVGKSTTAVNIAAVLAQQGETPLLFDADEQPTATNWCIERNITYPTFPKIIYRQDYGDIDYIFNEITDQYTHIIVDAAGHDSVEMRAAMSVCDILLIPFKPSQADLDTLTHMAKVVSKAKLVNDNLKAYAFLSIAPTNSKRKEIEQSKAAINEFSEISLLNTVIHDRAVYIASISDGLGVVEMQGKSSSEIKAKEEMFSLVKEMLNGN